MNTLQLLAYGFSYALNGENIVACFLGVLLGTVVGVLPGLGPIGAMAMLIPITFYMSPTAGLIMCTGIFFGSMYGGSTTSILMNVPGETTSVIAAIDGYQMAKKGRAGAALAVCAIGSCVAGTFGLIGLMLFAPVLAELALALSYPEFASLAFVGLIFLSQIGQASRLKSYLMAVFGIFLGTVGMEPMSGLPRFTMGSLELSLGINIVPVAMGLYGISEVLTIAENATGIVKPIKVKFRELWPTKKEYRQAFPAIFRGTVLGFFIGLIPGPSSILSTFASYGLEKKVSGDHAKFGKGAIEGVAGPEAANNSAATAQLVPLLALGIPFAPATAMLLGALAMHGIKPGPLMMVERPEIFWGVVASMYMGNVILMILNFPLVGVFASILRLPQHILMGIILLLCLIASYTTHNSVLDIYVLIGMGVFGYILRKLRFDMAPLILGLVLGPTLERNILQSLYIYKGDIFALISRPITASLLLLSLMGILLPVIIFFIGKFIKFFLQKESRLLE